MQHPEYSKTGRIDTIEEKETKNGKKYTLTIIEGSRYSIWKSDVLDAGYKAGDLVSYVYQEGDKGFKNIVKMQKMEDGKGYRGRNKYVIPSDSQIRSMLKMNALKSAATVVARDQQGSATEREELVLSMAKRFEKYLFEDIDYSDQGSEKVVAKRKESDSGAGGKSGDS